VPARTPCGALSGDGGEHTYSPGSRLAPYLALVDWYRRHRPVPTPDTPENGFHLLCTLFGISQTVCVATTLPGPTVGYYWDSTRREHTILIPTGMNLQELPLDTALVLVAAMKVLELEIFDAPEGAIAYLYRSPSGLAQLLPETAQPLVPLLTQILNRRRALLLTQLQRELESPEPEAANPGGPTPVLDSEMLALSLLTLPKEYR
jgi:hypothetical protein